MTHLSINKSIEVLLLGSLHQHQTIKIIKAPVENRFKSIRTISTRNTSTGTHWDRKHSHNMKAEQEEGEQGECGTDVGVTEWDGTSP